MKLTVTAEGAGCGTPFLQAHQTLRELNKPNRFHKKQATEEYRITSKSLTVWYNKTMFIKVAKSQVRNTTECTENMLKVKKYIQDEYL